MVIADLLSRIDALRARIESLAPLVDAGGMRMAEAGGPTSGAFESPIAQTTPESLVRDRARKEARLGPLRRPPPGPPPPTPAEESALLLMRDTLERIAALHRERDERPYELAVAFHPPSRAVELQVHPGPRPSPVTRSRSLTLRASAEPGAVSLEVRDGRGQLAGRATLAGSPHLWDARDVDEFVVRAVDGFLDQVLG